MGPSPIQGAGGFSMSNEPACAGSKTVGWLDSRCTGATKACTEVVTGWFDVARSIIMPALLPATERLRERNAPVRGRCLWCFAILGRSTARQFADRRVDPGCSREAATAQD